MKKKYMKPNSGNILSYANEDITPLAIGAALAGGFIVGRAAKQMIEIGSSANKIKQMRKVVVY